MLGQYLNVVLSEKHNILTLYHINRGNTVNYTSAKVDLLNNESLIKIIKEFKPDIVLHNAAVSNAAKADVMPKEIVEKINVDATKTIAETCSLINAALIFTSTDLVYDGNGKGVLTENSRLNPISLYAETKLQGERIIQNTFEKFIILRVALLVGFGLNHSKNHFQYMCEQLKQNKKVELFTDQYRSPMEAQEAAKIISALIDLNLYNLILNFGGGERFSRFEIGKLLCKIAGFSEELLVPVSMEMSSLKYKVRDVSLNIGRLKGLGLSPEPVELSLRRILKGKLFR